MTDVVYGRDLGLAGLPNARDLGGYPTATGNRVRGGVLFRSDAPVSATDDDLAALGALGIRCVIDLRGDAEIERFGLSPWTAPRVHLPVGDVSGTILAAVMMSDGDEPMTAETSERMMTDMYRSFVADDVSRAQFAEALRLIADPDGLPLLFHCAAGKDRTGWLSAIVLTALGVDEETVFADYLLTNERFGTGRGAVTRDVLLTALGEMIPDIGPIIPLMEARSGYLAAAFDEVSARYGTFEAFLDDGLGADVAGLRANLLP
jgi:protein-tyrosine phosphatase